MFFQGRNTHVTLINITSGLSLTRNIDWEQRVQSALTIRDMPSVHCPPSRASLEKAEICMHWGSKWLLGSKRVTTLEMWAFLFVLFIIPSRHSLLSAVLPIAEELKIPHTVLLLSIINLHFISADWITFRDDNVYYRRNTFIIDAWRIQFLSLFFRAYISKSVPALNYWRQCLKYADFFLFI